MKFVSLEIHNFLAIGSATIRLADRGLVLLQGENNDDTSADSNGAGKSSVADALCWAIYGTTARGEEGDKVVNRTAGKDCSVVVTIEDGADTYRITRHRKHKAGKNSLTVTKADGAGLVDLTKGTTPLTQDAVNEIVGSSYDVFRSSIYAGQESFPDLPAMTDKQLKVLVEEASGVTLLEKAYEDARARLAEVKARADRIEAEKKRLALRRADVDEQIRRSEARVEDFETDRKTALDTIANRTREAVAQVKRLKADVDGRDEAKVRAAIAACDKAIGAVSGEVTEERRLVSELGRAEARVTAVSTRLRGLTETLKRQVQGVKEVDHKIGCPCDDCGRPLTAAEVEPTKIARTKAARATRDEIDKVKVEAEEASGAHKALTGALSDHRASMTDVSAKASERASHVAELDTIEKLKAGITRFTDDARRWSEEHKAQAAKANPYREDVTRLQAETAELDRNLALVQSSLDEIAIGLRVAEIGVSVFAPAGVRAEILDTVTPFLNAQTAKYLSILSDDNIQAEWTTLVKNAKGELREKFAIEVTTTTGGERFTSVSGGEKRKVRIAAALALQDLVSSRATKPIELFVGDEIDNALDAAGLERLMVLLEEKARERGTVIVVSHVSLRDWIPQVMTVVKKGGLAEIMEEMA